MEMYLEIHSPASSSFFLDKEFQMSLQYSSGIKFTPAHILTNKG